MPASARVSCILLALSLSFAAQAAGAAEDPRDKAAVTAVLQSVLENEKSGVEVPWSSSITGNAGTIEVLRTYFPTPERPCRDYVRSVVTPAGEKTTFQGSACRTGPENWALEAETLVTEKPNTAPGTVGKPKDAGKTVEKAPETAAKPDKPKPAKTTVEKAAPPRLDYSLPTSSAI
ncbi:MAG TPA: RT0821/Lpp0805 family surface protein [Kiloniellaceae bacterium]|nr:RT0821/Lpp0805 family surface protein [Kiloniellaceae bacterium]